MKPGDTNKSSAGYMSVPVVYSGDETTNIPGNQTYDV